MLLFDLEDALYTVFRWAAIAKMLVLGVALFLCARVGLWIGRRCARQFAFQCAVSAAVFAVGAYCCMVVFVRNMKEDYAYEVLGGESEYSVPYAMRWLVEHGGKSRLVRTVCAPVDAENIEMRNTRLYAAMVLAKKDPEGSREILARVSPFDKPCCGNPDFVFGTNRYSWPVAGTDVLQMQWNDGTNQIPYVWKDIVEAW